LLLLTGQRRGEIACLRSGWIDWDTRDLEVLRLIFLVALGLATFLVVFFLVAFVDFLIGVFLPLFAFAFRFAIASPQIV
jgi:hypothetical protein